MSNQDTTTTRITFETPTRTRQNCKFERYISKAELATIRCLEPLHSRLEDHEDGKATWIRLYIHELFTLRDIRALRNGKKVTVPVITSKTKDHWKDHLRAAEQYLRERKADIDGLDEGEFKGRMLNLYDWSEGWYKWVEKKTQRDESSDAEN